MIDGNSIPYFEDKKNPIEPGKPTVERNVVHVILYDPKTEKVLCLDRPNFDWKTFIVGGVDEGEDILTAAKREIAEETGYTDVQFIREVGKTKASFYAANKGVNRIANVTGLLFELRSDRHIPISEEESKNGERKWINKKDVADFINIENQLYIWQNTLSLL